MAKYRLVGGGTLECREPADGLARGGAGNDRATREGEGGFTTRKWGSRVLSLTERACPFFSLVRSPRAHPGGPGMAWALRMDERPNPGENKKPRVWLSRITPSG
jgi:hypothetical protein